MMRLPLFPLNTVLFPGVPLSLHIFEDRYKQMISKCVDERQPFGVVLIEKGREAYGPAEPYSIGCTARITQVQPLAQGRLNIVATGQDRFRIRELDFSLPYLTGQVDLLPLLITSRAALDVAGSNLRPWIERYVDALGRSDNLRVDMEEFPADPLSLGYLGAYLLQIPLEQKQELLASPDALGFVRRVQSIYRREVALLSAMLARHAVDEDGPFSLN